MIHVSLFKNFAQKFTKVHAIVKNSAVTCSRETYSRRPVDIELIAILQPQRITTLHYNPPFSQTINSDSVSQTIESDGVYVL